MTRHSQRVCAPSEERASRRAVRIACRGAILTAALALGGCVAGGAGEPDSGTEEMTPEAGPRLPPPGDELPLGLHEGFGDDEASIWESDGWGMTGVAPPLDAPDPPDEIDDGAEVSDFDGAGLGAADPGEGGGEHIADPCRYPRRRGYHVITGTPGSDRIRGTNAPDLIFGLGGSDVIAGRGGNDVICAGGGADRLYGGHGRDYLDAGLGRDYAHGGPGDDVIHGRNGGDRLRGGAGDDWLSGDVVDDVLFGGSGADTLIGAHGTDYLHGGEGADYLRGDTGHDTFVGGVGTDTVSFMTATPPGQPRNETAPVMQDGVLVDLSDRFCGTPEGELRSLGWDGCGEEHRWDGLASGDGFREALRGVERVVGSAFDDTLIAGGGTLALIGAEGDDVLQTAGSAEPVGGTGTDMCDGSPCEAAEGPSRPAGAYVAVDGRPRDVGLIVLGSVGDADDALRIVMEEGRVRVSSDTGAAIAAGAGCANPAGQPSVVVCDTSSLRYVLAYGGDGDDFVSLSNAFPRDLTAHLDGGFGDDTISGSDGEDILIAGRTGLDVLSGGGGDDALISPSRGADRGLRGEEYGGGADLLDGGPGNDQLVSDYPCGGHTFRGGRGVDIAGFARSPDLPIHGQLGGEAENARAFHGYAYNPDRCALLAYGTQLAPGLEVLEGADGVDRLFGNHGPNVIWGWGGGDYLDGDGGDDVVEGHRGADEILGGTGADRLRGNREFDTLHAADGRPDRELSCGGGSSGDGGRLFHDSGDPAGSGCSE